MRSLEQLEPALLVQHADALVARHEYSRDDVRRVALETLGKLEPVALAQHANAVVARLEDSAWEVRYRALVTLRELEPATLAQHADAVVARLLDYDSEDVHDAALKTLGKLEPAALAYHAHALLLILEDDFVFDDDPDSMLHVAVDILRHGLPRFVLHGINIGDSRGLNNDDIDFYFDFHALRRRLMGRIAWYRCRIRLRVRSLSLYWYALPYRPSGPGHARDVEAWNHMMILE